MTTKWPHVRLDQLFEIGSSKRVMKSDWSESGVPFYRGREISTLATFGNVENDLFISEELYESYAKKYGIPAAGDLMMTAIGTVGNVWVVEANHRFYFKDASVLWLAKKQDCSSEFIKYWMKSKSFFDQLKLGTGATVDSLTIGRLCEVEVPLPPLDEQERIVAKLDEALGDLDKVTEYSTIALDQIDALWGSCLEEIFKSNPESSTTSKWPNIALGEVCNVVAGQSPDGQNYNDMGEGTPFYQGKKEFGLKFLGAPKVWTRQVTKTANAGDIVMSVRAPVGPVNLVNENCCIGRGLAALQVRSNLNRDFLYYFLEMSQEDLLSNEGTVFPSINKKQIESISLPFPQLDEQRRIVVKLDDLKEQIDSLRKTKQDKIRQANSLRSSILSAAFAGDL